MSTEVIYHWATQWSDHTSAATALFIQHLIVLQPKCQPCVALLFQNSIKSLNPSSCPKKLKTYLFWSTTILTSVDMLGSFCSTGPLKANADTSCAVAVVVMVVIVDGNEGGGYFLTCWTNGSIVLPLGAWNHLICQG